MTESRIKALDGFRAIAVLGVLWAHIWMFHENPAYVVAGINVAGIFSFFGTGVDLFFVISGFCMYLMFASRADQSISLTYFSQYLKKRWFRIAPAFYVAIAVYGLSAVNFDFRSFNFAYALKHALFIKNFFAEKTQYAPHFWSLCTEWHFYVFLPLLLIGIHKLSFSRCILIVVVVCLIVRFFFWMSPDDSFNIINYSIPNRLIEFVLGITAAWVYLAKRKELFFNSYVGLIIGVLFAFAGRLLMSRAFHENNGLLSLFARVWDIPLLTLGFSLLIVNTLLYRSIVTRMLEIRLMTLIGKYSYSMYLWHWLVAGFLSDIFRGWLHIHPFWQTNLIFILSLLILYPLSHFSYLVLESSYFRSKKPHLHKQN